MYETSDIRKNLKILVDSEPYIVVDFQFVKPGKGNAFTRTRLKNMITGAVLDKTFKTGEKLRPADIEERKMTYLYHDGDSYYFMDGATYDQILVPSQIVGNAAHLMAESVEVSVLFFSDRPVGITLPNFVELQVIQSPPGIRGDTATGATKQATLATGKVINVPLFVQEGQWIKIDTRDGQYVERVKR